MIRHLAMLALVALLTPTTALAGDKSEALARELIAATGGDALGEQVMDQMMTALQGTAGIPDAFFVRFKELAKERSLKDMVVPIYVENLDDKTMKAAIKFYRSGEGRKLVAALPGITQASMAAGQEWGAELGQRAMMELMAEQVGELEVPPEPAPAGDAAE